MRSSSFFFCVLLLFASNATAAKPIKALLIAGGCCHDYQGQSKAISEGIQARANVQVDVYLVTDSSVNPPLPLYATKGWADGYDVIIHDECAAGNKDVAVVNRILEIHKTIPAVHLHCAMHSFRNGTDAWAKHLGLLSTSHGPQVPIQVRFTDSQHPITKPLKDWTTIKEELYNNAKIHTAHGLATGTQLIRRGDKTNTAKAIVVWTNESMGARSFSTTLGHNTATVQDPRYLELVTRGLLWSCGKLNETYLVPFKGKNVVRVDQGVAEFKAQQAVSKAAKLAAAMPKDATLVKLVASSVQDGHDMFHSIDGDRQTRWCASGGAYPQFLQLQFDSAKTIDGITIDWEFDDAYQYKVLGSIDGKAWKVLSDQTKNERVSPFSETWPLAKDIKFIRIDAVGSRRGGWCSIREIKVSGKDIRALWPAANGNGFKPVVSVVDPYKKQGNVPPEIVPPTQAGSDLLKNVRVPDGFEATIFAAPPAVNYPVFVAAAPDGTLYVSSDGNGSLGRDPNRGRVIRLRDTDGDGRADQTKVFCEVDSPRGLVWDHDRLYLMHPPNLSVFFDKDLDGVADSSKVLVKNLAFGFDKRPADHTTNGLSIGADGYLYIAGGDFGFMDAEGTDGTKLTHRGGGVIRVRPDGTGLELYATGTRNILEVAISPQMDLFARDNTNDGGGWDVRFHHFTGGEDHGYPRLYKNFNDECVQPLADYGGGSGCGAFYLDEPGFGEWNNAPMTADWGKGTISHHQIVADGATFKETNKPREFLRLERATDGDVDGMSRVYAASWRGATFKWAGPNVGYIVQVKPKDYQPTVLPKFTELSEQELVALFDSPSYRRRLAAQRELMRRGSSQAGLLLDRAVAKRTADRNLVDHLRADATAAEVVDSLGHVDPVVVHVAIRELARRGSFQACFDSLKAKPQSEAKSIALFRALAMMHRSEVVDGVMSVYSQAEDPTIRQRCLSTLCRLHSLEGEWKGQSWGTRPDTRGPYYQPDSWEQSGPILDFLKTQLTTVDPKTASFLATEMSRNRIQSSDAVKRILALAANDDSYLPQAVKLIDSAGYTSADALPVLIQATTQELEAATLSAAISGLTRFNEPEVLQPILDCLHQLESRPKGESDLRGASRSFFRSRVLNNQIETLIAIADKSPNHWADAALLQIAGQKNAALEARQAAAAAIDSGWQSAARRVTLIKGASRSGSHFLDDRILGAVDDVNPEVAAAAVLAMKRLKIKPLVKVDSPLISSLKVEQAVARVMENEGDRDRGEVLFSKANCVACHTVTKSVAQKGPYLGNIAQTYKRLELVQSILLPNKSIAQGFATTNILTDDGNTITGFVTKESANQVTLRDAQAKEVVINKDEIEIRKTLKTSVMPQGLMDKYTVHDVASIVAYLQSLSKK